MHRYRLDMKKVKGFIDFISRSTFLQDVAFGKKVLKLSSEESIVIQSNPDYPDLDYPDFSIIRTFSLVRFFS